MSNILRYKSIVAVCLCFIFVFSFFSLTFQRSEAIATIPLVAVPIIKLLIASGVTFLSVDAMLEVYNRMKGTDYYNTLTGNILNVLDDLSEDLVSSWLFHDWAMQQPDPPGSGWPEWPELLLGTLCLEIAKSDSFFQNFLDWFNDFKEDGLESAEIVMQVDNDCGWVDYGYWGVHSVDNRHDEKWWILHVGGYVPVRIKSSFVLLAGSGGLRLYTEIYDLDDVYISGTGLSYAGGLRPYRVGAAVRIDDGEIGCCRIYMEDANNVYREGNGGYYKLIPTSLPVEDYVDMPELDIDIIDDNFQNNVDDELEIYVPMPNEIITYDPDTGLDIDFDTEISIEEFEELMTPYVGSTWEDIKQDKPIPSKIPTDVPYPDDPVVPDPLIPEMPDLEEEDLPPDADEGDDPFTGADEGKTIDWDPLKGIGLHKKFPFCIPWDIYDSFRAFNVEGEAPCWKVEFLHDTEFTIDFSIFEPWAVIVRWGILILFNLGLILATRNLIRG